MGLLIYMIMQLTSMIVSINIKLNTYKKLYKNIGDSGYKIDADKVEQLLDEHPRNSIITKIIDTALFIIPGINIISSLSRRLYDTKKFSKVIEKYDALIPMTEEEIEKYSKLQTLYSKAMFVSCFDAYSKSVYEINIFLGDELNVLQNNIAQLYYEKLPALSYTLEEVKKLSESINSSYKLGKMDGINIAIIGLPYECQINQTIVKKEDSLKKYEYQLIDEKDIKDERFIVYPFGIDFKENEELQTCYQEIVNNRDSYRKSIHKKMNNFINYPSDNKVFIRVKRK